MTKPRIFIIIGTFHPQVGGAERQALLQGRELRARGYDVSVMTLRHNRAWPRHEVVEGVPVTRTAGAVLGGREKLPSPLRKLAYIFGVLGMGWALWRRRRSYDLLHVYQLNVLTLPATLVCVLTGKPVIVSVRCADAGHQADSRLHARKRARLPLGSNRQPASANRMDGSSGDLAALDQLGKPIGRLICYLLRRSGAVVTVLTTRIEADLAAHGFHLVGVQVIPNGVDLERFRPAATGAPPTVQMRTVLFVGRLSYQKGVDVLLHAWRTVREQLPEPEKARLTIVGAGPRRGQLEQLGLALGIADSVEFAGLQCDVAPWLAHSDLLVLPSRWEGMPNAVLEAMACGLPCVATRVSGSEDVIEHGVNGMLVEPGDPQALARAVLALLVDSTLRRKYGRAARATIEQRYALDHVMDVYSDLYDRLCSSTLKPISSTGPRTPAAPTDWPASYAPPAT